MSDLWLALKSYLYGIGWMLICIQFCIIGIRLFDKFSPVDFKKEVEEKNMAFAVIIGLYLFGLTFGMLYFASHVS